MNAVLESSRQMAQGTNYLNDYRTKLNVPRVQGMQENEIRETHHMTRENLKAIKQVLLHSFVWW